VIFLPDSAIARRNRGFGHSSWSMPSCGGHLSTYCQHECADTSPAGLASSGGTSSHARMRRPLASVSVFTAVRCKAAVAAGGHSSSWRTASWRVLERRVCVRQGRTMAWMRWRVFFRVCQRLAPAVGSYCDSVATQAGLPSLPPCLCGRLAGNEFAPRLHKRQVEGAL
jgi:hypothetical protein